MESPVVVDKPPEYHGRDDRGFPFDDDEGSDAWSELAARHPDIAARLRQRDPSAAAAAAAWARKRRSPQADDFSDSFSNFDRFPFNDIPPEFREHFPSRWNRRFGSRDEGQPQEQCQPQQHPQPPQSPSQQSTSTQTEHAPPPHSSEAPTQHQQIPQYGLRNTVDLGQKSAADPSLVDGEDRSHRSMSAPPESGPHTMSSPHPHHPEPAQSEQPQQKVRTIPIFVEGRDEPVINKNLDSSSHFGESKPTYATPPPHHHQPPLDNSYFEHDGPAYIPPRNFTQTFGAPYRRQSQQPFAQQKVFPQSATFARGASPGRAHSPKPQHPEEIKIPVHHEKPSRPEPQRPQPKPQPQPQQQRPQPPHHQRPHSPTPPPAPQQQQPQQHEQTPPPQPPKQQTQPQDPITQILAIQTDVLNLMTEVEKFTGTKKDKQYMFLDEMLTRNLIKLDNIETDGKENIRNARKEAIKCIQKCIAVLEAKADGRTLNAQPQENQPSDEEMKDAENCENGEQVAVENGEAEMKESKEAANVATVEEQQTHAEVSADAPAEQNNENSSQAADTRPEGQAPDSKSKDGNPEDKDNTSVKPKKGGKIVKKRGKSKDTADNKEGKNVEQKESVEAMQVDDKGDKEPQKMEVDGAASQ